MIHEVREDISVRDIKAVMDYLDGRMSVDQLMDEDGLEGEAFEDKNNEGPDIRNEVMDINVKRLYDTFLGKLKDEVIKFGRAYEKENSATINDGSTVFDWLFKGV